MRPGVVRTCPPFVIHCASICGLRKCRIVKASTMRRIPTTPANTVASMLIRLFILSNQLVYFLQFLNCSADISCNDFWLMVYITHNINRLFGCNVESVLNHFGVCEVFMLWGMSIT